MNNDNCLFWVNYVFYVSITLHCRLSPQALLTSTKQLPYDFTETVNICISCHSKVIDMMTEFDLHQLTTATQLQYVREQVVNIEILDDGLI